MDATPVPSFRGVGDHQRSTHLAARRSGLDVDTTEQRLVGIAADADASWGHRKPNTPRRRHEPFFGYYGQAISMVADEDSSVVPELIRRVALHPCDVDPPTALAATLESMAALLPGDAGVPARSRTRQPGGVNGRAGRPRRPHRRAGPLQARAPQLR